MISSYIPSVCPWKQVPDYSTEVSGEKTNLPFSYSGMSNKGGSQHRDRPLPPACTPNASRTHGQRRLIPHMARSSQGDVFKTYLLDQYLLWGEGVCTGDVGENVGRETISFQFPVTEILNTYSALFPFLFLPWSYISHLQRVTHFSIYYHWIRSLSHQTRWNCFKSRLKWQTDKILK